MGNSRMCHWSIKNLLVKQFFKIRHGEQIILFSEKITAHNLRLKKDGNSQLASKKYTRRDQECQRHKKPKANHQGMMNCIRARK